MNHNLHDQTVPIIVVAHTVSGSEHGEWEMSKPERRDLAKESFWRKTVADYRSSRLGPAEFCRQRGLNVNTLNSWARILRARDAETVSRNRRKDQNDEAFWWSALDDWRQSSLTLKDFARGRKLNYRRLLRWKHKVLSESAARPAETTVDTQELGASFVPVRVVDSIEPPVTSKPISDREQSSGVIEVVLKCGRTIRVHDCQPEVLRAMVLAVESCG
jgi:hypothetical protein